MTRWAVLAAVVFGGSVGFGQMTEQSIAAKLRGRVLMLRGMYAGDELHFDAKGNLIGPGDPLAFSISAIQVKNLSLTDSALEVQCRHAGLVFQYKRTGKDGKVVGKLGTAIYGKDLHIIIDRDPQHHDDLSAALNKVLSVGIDDQLVSAAPDYWKPWLQQFLHPETSAPPTTQRTSIHPTGKVSPPRMIYDPDPGYSLAADAIHLNGTSVVGFVVDTSGVPQQIHIVQPLGMGLDELAVEDAAKMRFKPAMLEGKPVPVEINVEVNFRR